MKSPSLLVLFMMLLASSSFAQITGKFGTYYDQRELLFESLPTAPSDIIFLGNSITDGSEWSELFQNPHCKNRGISGDIIPGVLNRLETVTKGQPAMIFLMIGTNDMNHGYSNDSIAQGVRAIIQRIKAESPRTRLIVQSILPTNDCYGLFTGHTKRWKDVEIINDMLIEIAGKEGVDYLDLYHPFATEEGKMNPDYSNDGLHLNAKGYALWKSIIEDYYGKFPKPVYKNGKVAFWVHLSSGSSFVDSFEQGSSPLSYFGFGGNMSPGFTVEWSRYRIHLNTHLLGTIAINKFLTESFFLGMDGRAEFLYRCHDTYNNQLHLWAGTTLQSYLDLKYQPQMMNAALGTSSFFNLHATGMVQYDFVPMLDKEHNLFTLYGKLSLPLVGTANRPGFAYIDNPTATEDSNHHEQVFLLFPGVSTDLGFFVNLRNKNKIGISYRWDYLTTRHQGIYRFDQACHSFNFTYMFNIN